MQKNFDTLNKALDSVKKSQSNFINGDGRDNRDTIHTNPINNENGSISRTAGATGDGNDPVNSSNLTHKNPTGQSANGVHAEGTKTTKEGNATNDHSPMSESGDGHADDPENKSVNKDKNGVKEPKTQLHNNTRKMSDKPNGNAQAEDHALNHTSSGQHNDAEITASINKLVNISKSLINAVKVNSGHINALKSEYTNDINNLNNKITKTNKAINAPGINRNTVDKSDEAKTVAGVDPETNKHMNPANIRGMFYHAEHDKGKHHTKEMADAENAVTRCHHSHKNITPDKMADIEAKAYVQAAKSIMSQLGDENAAKSLDSKLVHDAQSGNTSALAKDNYKYDQSEKAQHAHKSVGHNHSLASATGAMASEKNAGNDSAVARDNSYVQAHKSEAANTMKGMMTSCHNIMSSAAKAGNSSAYNRCARMCSNMAKGNAAKSEAADLFKNVDSEDHDSKANTSNMSAVSDQKPTKSSDDVDNSTKSESANATKSMPHGKAVNAEPTKKSMKKSAKKSPIMNPRILHNQANLYKSIYKERGKHMAGSEPIVHKSMQLCDQAIKNDDPETLQKSISTFRTLLK